MECKIFFYCGSDKPKNQVRCYIVLILPGTPSWRNETPCSADGRWTVTAEDTPGLRTRTVSQVVCGLWFVRRSWCLLRNEKFTTRVGSILVPPNRCVLHRKSIKNKRLSVGLYFQRPRRPFDGRLRVRKFDFETDPNETFRVRKTCRSVAEKDHYRVEQLT